MMVQSSGKESLIGVRRILAEAQGRPDGNRISRKYSSIVEDIAKNVRLPLESVTYDGGSYKLDLLIASQAYKLMEERHSIAYGTNKYSTLVESVRTGLFDCDNSAYLLYDSLDRLGAHGFRVELLGIPLGVWYHAPPLDLGIVIVPGHALLKVNKWYFESTSGVYYQSESDVKQKYPGSFYVLHSSDEIHALSLVTISSVYEAVLRNARHANQFFTPESLASSPSFQLQVSRMGDEFQNALKSGDMHIFEYTNDFINDCVDKVNHYRREAAKLFPGITSAMPFMDWMRTD